MEQMLFKWLVFGWSLFTVFSCGAVKDDDGSSHLKIVGGHKADYYPFFVQLLAGAKSPQGFCGGTLIAPRVVITAAHCIQSELAKDLYVAMGLTDGGSLHLTRPVKVIGVVKHANYLGVPEHGADIALLYLDLYAHDQFRRPVKSAVVDTTGAIGDHETLRAVGLGRLSSLGEVRGDIIQEVDLPVVPFAVCKQSYDINNSQLCAGYVAQGGRDSCQGDSGGPLLRIKSGGQLELVGLVSYGHGCAQKKQPGVYTKVSAYSAWISEKSQELALELDPKKPTDAIKEVVATRCLAQVNGLTEHTVTNGSSRDTRWKVDDGKSVYNPVGANPKGTVLGSCEFEDKEFDNVSVKWIKLHAADKSVVAVVALKSGKLYQSTAMPLSYSADSLYCTTSRGPVAFYDTRTQSYVSYNDRIYHFGEATHDPADNQLTWGCHSTNMVVELFEMAETGKLAARVSHPAVGTLVRVLDIASTPPELILKTWLSKDDNGLLTLRLKNVSNEDLFTWQLECAQSFVLTTKKGPVTALPRSVGSGFYSLLLEGQTPEASLLGGSAIGLPIQFAHPNPVGYGCIINRMFPVLDP